MLILRRHRIGSTRRHLPWLALVAGVLAGCGADTGAPEEDGALRAAAELDRLADSVSDATGGLTAEALRHAADLVRLAGTTTTITLLIDGVPETFAAVAEQLDLPMYQCPAPDGSGGGGGEPGDSTGVGVSPPSSGPGLPEECEPAGTYSMRTLIAWSGDFARVVRLVADPGFTPAQPDVPDVMGGAPPTVPDGSTGGGDGVLPGDSTTVPPPDSVVAEPPRYPGFLGEYLVAGAGVWWATEGEQENELLQSGGACTEANPVLDWAEFECTTADIGFRFTMRVEHLLWEPLTGTVDPATLPPHEIAMPASDVAGVRLLLVAWYPPDPLPPDPGPLPPGEPPPSDSTRPDGTVTPGG